MFVQVEAFVTACDVCQKIKVSSYNYPPLSPLSPSKPLELVTADLTGEMPTTVNRKDILVIVDHFTKFVQCYPFPNQRADTVAETLASVFRTRF